LIRNVVFDIGWVFVHLDPRPILDFLAEHEAPTTDLDTLVERIRLDDHESGRIHGRKLLERLKALTRRPTTLEALHEKWVDMFDLQPAMVDLAHRLADRYRVYLLSNCGDLHWAHLSREYGLHRIGHGALPSFVAGVMKPHEGIYAEAERRFGLDPRHTVFIDDRTDNIAAARSRGWHGIVHAGYEPTRAALAELGVKVD
jgi:haloacid dehalogenase superfamily, subfamily IA, variant 3 with third motif having DD or ED